MLSAYFKLLYFWLVKDDLEYFYLLLIEKSTEINSIRD